MTEQFELPDLIKEAERELKQREHVYPRLVAKGTLSARAAQRQIDQMQAIIERLRQLDASERLI